MRKDMFKVIVERPRSNSRWADSMSSRARERHELANILKNDWSDDDVEDSKGLSHELNTHEPMKNRYNSSKSLNENLSPLYRFLEKSVGRPWDEVYSEVREHLRMDSAIQLHVVQHLKWAITEDTYIGEDGHVYSVQRNLYRSGALDIPEPYARHNYYVHPETKLLCRQPKMNKKVWRAKETTVLPLSRYRQFRLINGKWMVVELADIQYGNPDQAPNGKIAKYDNKTKFTYFHPNFECPDILFPDGLEGRKRYDEYGDYDLHAISIRDVGVREQKVLETLLKKE